MEISKEFDGTQEKGTNQFHFKKESIFQKGFRFVFRCIIYLSMGYYAIFWIIYLIYKPLKFLYEVFTN